MSVDDFHDPLINYSVAQHGGWSPGSNPPWNRVKDIYNVIKYVLI